MYLLLAISKCYPLREFLTLFFTFALTCQRTLVDVNLPVDVRKPLSPTTMELCFALGAIADFADLALGLQPVCVSGAKQFQRCTPYWGWGCISDARMCRCWFFSTCGSVSRVYTVFAFSAFNLLVSCYFVSIVLVSNLGFHFPLGFPLDPCLLSIYYCIPFLLFVRSVQVIVFYGAFGVVFTSRLRRNSRTLRFDRNPPSDYKGIPAKPLWSHFSCWRSRNLTVANPATELTDWGGAASRFHHRWWND